MNEGTRIQHWAAALSAPRGAGWGLFRPAFLFPLVLLLLAGAFGGAQAHQPLRDIAVQLGAVAVLSAAILGWCGKSVSPDARIPLILIIATAVLLLFQLVPLPAGIWTSLGGRALSQSVLQLIGVEPGARPLSVQPELTMLSALSLLPGFAMAIVVMRLGTGERVALVWGVVGVALASLALGAVQYSLGEQASTMTLYRQAHTGMPIGLFANTNHQADLLAIGFIITGTLAPIGRRGFAEQPWWAYGVMIALAAGVVATGSRAGIGLLVLGFLAMLARQRLSGHVRTFLLGGTALVGALVLLILFNPIFARSFADFSNVDDGRFHFWPNVLYAIGEFGWLGTGAGTFQDVYRSVETLDTLSPRILNHAHNDYLEIVLEMGVPGALLVICFLAFFVWRGIAIIRNADAGMGRRLGYAGMVCAGILLLHSAADYPLRTPLLGTVFGLCCALMTRPPLAGRPTPAALSGASDMMEVKA